MNTDARQFNAQKNGRPVAARSVHSFVLWPTFSSVSDLSASLLSSRFSWPLRSWLRTWQGRRVVPTVVPRDSSPAHLHASIWRKADAFHNGGLFKKAAFVNSLHMPAPILFWKAAFVAGIKPIRGNAGDDSNFVHVRSPNRAISLFDFRCHFLFSFRPGVGLVLFSANTIPNCLAIVNRKNENIFTGAEAPTPAISRRRMAVGWMALLGL